MKETVRVFAEKEIAPTSSHYDQAQEFPSEIFEKMADLNLMGIFVPTEYGGAGADNVSWVICMEELSRVNLSISLSLLGHCHAVRSILLAGSEEQKKRYLTPIASGDRIAAFALTEPGAGTDAAAISTTARAEGKDYILNGTKAFITNAGGVAGTCVVGAKTNPSKGARGVSLFVVEKGTPGLSFGKVEDKMGTRASITGEIIFEDCVIPHENLLGEEGRGFRYIMKAFAIERAGNASMSVGLAQGAYEYALEYSKERKAFNRPISEFQGLRWMLADMAVAIQASRLMVYYGASLADKEKPHNHIVSMAKLMSNEVCMKITTDAVQILGAYGYSKEHPVERMMRDAKMLAIGGGTTQIQRDIIARHILS